MTSPPVFGLLAETCTVVGAANVLRPSGNFITLANDQTFVEFAQGLARRLLLEGPADDAARITQAFRWSLSRDPTAPELQRVSKLLEEQRTAFTTELAQKFAPSNLPETISPTEAAAWTAIARVLINLDEFITRE